LKKVVGRTDIEDSLVRLDLLTQEEVRMAAAQGLKATHAVHDEVKSADDHIHQVDTHVQGVDDKVQGVDSKVQQVDDHIQQVDDRMQGVGGDVQQIGTHVQGVDDKVQGVDNRIQGVESKIQDVDNKVQQVADHMGYQKRSSSNNLILLAIMMNAQLLPQAISYERTSDIGSPPQIHL
jgi:archaellum component FlaC